MTPSEELYEIFKKQLYVVEESVMNLFRDFIKKAPVDTGAFRAAWAIEQTSDKSWILTNNVEYASILWDGRRIVANRAYGSEQWPAGGDVMIRKFNRDLQRKLDRI